MLSKATLPNIDINPKDWEQISLILGTHVSGYEVWAFGSRAKWTAKPYSDLDLAVLTERPLSLEQAANLKEAFEESNLPFKVDLVDWAAISDSFRNIVKADKVVVQQAFTGRQHWEVKKLIDCTRDGNLSYGIVQPGTPTVDGVPILRVNNFSEGYLELDDVMRVAPDVEAKYKRTRLEGGEVLLTLVGSVGKSVVAPKKVAGWNIARAVGVIRPKPDIGAEWINICLQSEPVRQFLDERANTTVQKTLNLADVKEVPIPLPPRHVKETIESIALGLSRKIELNRRMNVTLERMARAVFQSWFVDFDPVRAKLNGRQPLGLDAATTALFPNAFEDSFLGRIPQGWKTGSILRQADLLSGGTPKTDVPAYWNGDIPWASAKDVSQCGESFLLRTDRTVTNLGVEESATKIIPALSTVVVARGATTGRLTMLSRAMAMNQTCYALRSKTDSPYSLYCNTQHFIERLVQGGHGSIFDTITTSTFEATEVLLAPMEVLRAFDRQVKPLFAQVLTNLEQSRTLAHIRETLLPKLLSGEMPVGHLNISSESLT